MGERYSGESRGSQWGGGGYSGESRGGQWGGTLVNPEGVSGGGRIVVNPEGVSGGGGSSGESRGGHCNASSFKLSSTFIVSSQHTQQRQLNVLDCTYVIQMFCICWDAPIIISAF